MSILRIIRSRIQLNRARAAEAGGDLATAFKIYREIVMDFYGTMRADILNKLGRLAYALRDLPAARTWYEQALAIEPDAYVIHMNLANTLHNLGLQDAARASYENALARSRGPDVLYNYALFVADEDPRAAFALIRESLDSVHSLDEVGLADELFLRLLVRVGQRAELFDDVSLYLDELEARSSIWLEPWSVANQRAILLSRAGRHDEALARFGRILETWPRETDVRFNLGMALVRLARWEAAREQFAQVDHPIAHYGIALTYEQSNRPSDAAREYGIFLDQIAQEPSDPLRLHGIDWSDWIEKAKAFIATRS